MKVWGRRILSLLAALALCFAIDFLFGSIGHNYLSRLAFLAGLYVTLAVSLNIINGICGQFSLGHAAFYHIGAYTGGFLTVTFYQRFGMDMLPWLLILLPVGALLAGLVGFIVGLPSLKLKGDYLAIVTLGFGEIIRIITINIAEIGGSYGIVGIPVVQPIWLAWFIAIVCIAVSRNLVKSAHGLSFLAVREDEIAAAAMGVNVTKTKVTAFVIGSAFAGAAGVLFAHFEGYINPDYFRMEVSFIILTMVVLGGTGSITGAALAAVVLFIIPEYLRDMKDVNDIPFQVSGAALVGSILAVMLVVYAFKRIETRYHGTALKKAGLYVSALVGGFLAQVMLSAGFGQIPAMLDLSYEVSRLRMVIFAATLIIVMLLRPQGVLAHHELSWDWIKGLFRKMRRKEAAA